MYTMKKYDFFRSHEKMTFDTGNQWKTVGGASMMSLLRSARRALNETYI